MKRIVFCDFDGTITADETFVAMLKQFTPELSAQLLPEIYAQRLTLRLGVRQFLESIPSERYPAIVEFARPQPMRAGIPELLDFLESQQIPFVVVSGGLRGMVEAVVQPFRGRIHAIHAIDVDTSGAYLQVRAEDEGDTELVAKAQIMAAYAAEEAIAIGDSITDLNLALQAPIVFARAPLTRYLEEAQKPYIPWNDFFEIRDFLEKHIQLSLTQS